jgi:hypothetical protein
LKREGRPGNPSFLDGVLRCIIKRAEILGLDNSMPLRTLDPMLVAEQLREMGCSLQPPFELTGLSPNMPARTGDILFPYSPSPGQDPPA